MPTEELAFLPITELSKRIEAKKLSPVELTQYFLDRSQKLGPRYNAYALLTPEIAMAQAKSAEKEIQRGHYRGPLIAVRERLFRRFLICSPQSEASEHFVMTITE